MNLACDNDAADLTLRSNRKQSTLGRKEFFPYLKTKRGQNSFYDAREKKVNECSELPQI
jgi:hypothetical protein